MRSLVQLKLFQKGKVEVVMLMKQTSSLIYGTMFIVALSTLRPLWQSGMYNRDCLKRSRNLQRQIFPRALNIEISLATNGLEESCLREECVRIEISPRFDNPLPGLLIHASLN